MPDAAELLRAEADRLDREGKARKWGLLDSQHRLTDDVRCREEVTMRGTVSVGLLPLPEVVSACLHLDAVPVELLDDGEIVAHLCPDCDAQLPAEWAVAPALPAFPPVPELPPFVPDPRLTAYIQE